MLLLLLVACTGDPSKPTGEFEATLTPGDPGTVVVVSWTTDEPATSKVEFGTSTAYGKVTPRGDELTTDHKVMVVGMPASCDCFLRPYSETASGERIDGPALTYSTADPNPDIALVNADLIAPGADDTPLILTTVSLASGVVIVDGDGELIWWYAQPSTATGTQAKVSDDGLSVMFDSADSEHMDAEKSSITRMRLDGGDTLVTYDVSGHHDFWELEDGGYAYLKADIREMDYGGDGTLNRVVGDAVVEIAADGTVLREVWNAWDWLSVDYAEESPFYPGALDWTHANGMYATEDAYFVSSHNLNAIYKIDRATGELVWTLGGDDSDFAFVDGAEKFKYQHSPRWVDGDLYLFNNTDGTGVPPASYAVQFDVDETAMTVREARRYDGDGSSFSYVLGNVDVKADGEWLVNWGTVGLVEDITADDKPLRQLSTSIGYPVGNAHYTPELGGPIP